MSRREWTRITVAGADGCRAGWLCVLRQSEPPFEERAFLASRFEDILAHPSRPAVIAVDIPIGFPEVITGAGRDCDCAVRKILGKRAASVFSPPARAVFHETDYRQACLAAQAASDPPRQISKQMFHLFAKIREVDGVISPETPVFECSPEAAFWAMNSRSPLAEPKKERGRLHPPGLEMRRSLLTSHGYSAAFLHETRFPRAKAGCDDFLDACACSWSAARILNGAAVQFPSASLFDGRGLRMAIFA